MALPDPIKRGGDLQFLSPGGHTLVTGSDYGGHLVFWDAKTVQKRGEYRGERISDWAFSQDGRILAITNSNGKTQIVDTQTGQILFGQIGAERECFLAGPPDAPILAGLGSGGNVRVWDVAKKQQQDFVVASTIALTADGRTLATIDSEAITLWDVKTRKDRATIQTSAAAHGVFSLDGRLLVTSHFNGTLRLWDVAAGHQRATYRITPGRPSLAFSGDGTKLAVSYLSLDGTLLAARYTWLPYRSLSRLLDSSSTVVLDASNGQVLARLPECFGGTFLPDGRTIAAWRHAEREARSIELWDIPPRTVIRPFWKWVVLGCALGITALSFYTRKT